MCIRKSFDHENSDENASGWREVPGDDPEVQHVADHAVKTIQQRSNSLFPYELQEVVHANAEVSFFTRVQPCLILSAIDITMVSGHWGGCKVQHGSEVEERREGGEVQGGGSQEP